MLPSSGNIHHFKRDIQVILKQGMQTFETKKSQTN